MSTKYLKFFVLFFSFFSADVFAQAVPLHPFLDTTITSWHRFSVEETGVQKITENFLSQLGIPVDDIDPKTIRIYGRGGQMLPLKNAAEVETLYENPIWVVGEEDGSFDAADYILFMGYAGDTWNSESETFTNLYHNTAVYYITYGTLSGKRVLVEKGNDVVSANALYTGIYQAAIEKDNYNIGSLGRRWFGERFSDGQNETYSIPTPNVASGTKINVAARVAAAANTTTSITFSSGSESKLVTLGSSKGTAVAREPSTQFNGIPGMIQFEVDATDEVSTELSYDANGDFASSGYLDFILAQYNRNLSANGEGFLFTLDPSIPTQELAITNAASETTLWELNKNKVHTTPESATTFGSDVLVDADAIFFLASDYKTPIYRRNNRRFSPTSFLAQLKDSSDITYLLITTEAYREEAERLVEYRNNTGEQALLVTLEEIYEAFSTGQQDIAAIRNFVRYLYHSQGKKLKYLCLFGDTSFDYKKRTRSNDMVVPTFHALNSFSLANSFMSDDFFTMMEVGEGNLISADDDMDLTVGRMVFSNKTQATVAVDKVIAYEDAQNKGSWNNSYTILSDDADYANNVKNDYSLQVELNDVGDNLSRQNQFLNITKLFADSFKQESSAGGDSYPDVEIALENRLSQGTLAVQYFGHGGEDGLASEFLIDKKMAKSLFHPGKYPLFIVVTCEFTRFDNHDRQTAGELLYQNATGGALGLISTTRQIYVNEGIAFNKLITKYLFPSNGDEATSIAEALRKAKGEFRNTNQKRIILYIGDPALKLNASKPGVNITQINGVPVETALDDQKTMNALDKITLSGVLTNPSGEIQKDFNGEVTLQVFDKYEMRNVLNNDDNPSHQLNPFKFEVIGKQIFQGLSTVKDGEFTSTFVVPKDIDLKLGEARARITMIAFNEDKSESLGGYSDKFFIGGLNTSAPEDNQGPDLEVFLSNRNFVDGDYVFGSPTLIIDLADENGINTAGGIGHDITAVLDNNQTSPLLLNAFYAASLDDFTKGTITYPLNNLSTGLHTLTVRAWDTHNNPSTKTITFWVKDSSSLKIERVYNSPNPITNQTTFFVQHNRPRELLEANLYIFTTDGKRIWHSKQNVSSTAYLLDSLKWNATTASGEKVKKGIYLYTIELISTLSKTTDTHSAKLIID